MPKALHHQNIMNKSPNKTQGTHHGGWHAAPDTASVGPDNKRSPQGRRQHDDNKGFAVVQTKKREKK